MIVPDVNLLINAYNADFSDHAEARKWWESVLDERESIGLAWVTVLGFIRIMTHPRIMPNPMPVPTALAAVESWLNQPNVDLIDPGPRHAEILFRLIRATGVAADLTTDARLAALAIEYQAQLASTDNDFAGSPGSSGTTPF